MIYSTRPGRVYKLSLLWRCSLHHAGRGLSSLLSWRVRWTAQTVAVNIITWPVFLIAVASTHSRLYNYSFGCPRKGCRKIDLFDRRTQFIQGLQNVDFYIVLNAKRNGDLHISTLLASSVPKPSCGLGFLRCRLGQSIPGFWLTVIWVDLSVLTNHIYKVAGINNICANKSYIYKVTGINNRGPKQIVYRKEMLIGQLQLKR